MRFFFKNIIIIILAIVSLPAYPKIISANINATPISQTTEFSAEKAFEHVKYLVQKIGPRPAGSKSELKAAQYISYILNQYGWKVREQPFSKVVVRDAAVFQRDRQIELINSQNIIAELPGTLPDTIVVGAHYDTANLSGPGAVDNASGVGVLLELARVLSKEPHQDTYQLVFFGAEENGLVGSQYFTGHEDMSAVRWMLNVDMVGTPMEIDVAGKKSAPPQLVKQVTAIAGEINIPFHISSDFITMTRDSTYGGVSDFSPFLDQGIPAVGLGMAGRPAGYFHRPEDRLERVSLADIQKVGNYTHLLLQKVNIKKLGPSYWDDLYLPFQIGKTIIILPSLGIRIFIFAVFTFTVLLLLRVLKKPDKFKVTWKQALAILGIALLLSLVVFSLSGLGEYLWTWLKQLHQVWYAHPTIFLGARLGIALGAFVILAGWLPKLPLARRPEPYWLAGVTLLFGLSLILTLIRIDIAFPIVFWLLCMDLQYFLPNIFCVLIGPCFIYRWHYEILNSQQWVSYYETIQKHFLIFLIIYSLLLTPVFLAALHITIKGAPFWKKVLLQSRKPALILLIIIILSLGFVPNYTGEYPQTVTVQEEWSEGNSSVHVYSDENLPRQIVKELNAQPGTSAYLSTHNLKPPLTVKASLNEKTDKSERILNLSFKLDYTKEPYLIRYRFKSSKPFNVQTDDFLPMSKLPRKLQLKGAQDTAGKYSLVIQRTPPQKNLIQMSVEAMSIITCSIEGIFPDPSPQIQINNSLLSVDYQILFKKSYEF